MKLIDHKLPWEKLSSLSVEGTSEMALFNVYEHPNTKALDAVKQGYCFPVLFLNVLPFGWIWAFARKAPQFAWRLLAVSVMASIFAVLISADVIWILWTVFSVGLGGIANKQVEYSLKRRGYVLVRSGVDG
jgi:hypothetical protein